MELKSLEVYYDDNNRALLDDFVKRYDVEEAVVPSVFVGDTYLSGSDAIRDNLSNKIDYYYQNRTDCPLDINKIEGSTEEVKELELTLPAILVGAAADSINPCAFAVLTFLIVYLLAVKDKKQMLKIGLIFIFVVFLVYFISGLGILQLAKYITITSWIIKIIAVISKLLSKLTVKSTPIPGADSSINLP